MNKEIKPYAFIDREGNEVTRESYMAKRVGRAYGFFDCNASKEKIEAELPTILQKAKTPGGLEICLMEVKDLEKSGKVDPDLLQFIRGREIYATFPSKYKDQMKTAKPIKMTDLKYIIEATFPGESNEHSANHLGDVINGVYRKYGNEMPFNVAVVAKIDGEYLFKE